MEGYATTMYYFVCTNRIVAIALLLALTASAELQMVQQEGSQHLFSGKQRSVSVMFRNASKVPEETSVRAKLFQLTSATTAPVIELPAKPLRVLEGQTISETVTIDLPMVRTPTRFLLRWSDTGTRSLGQTDIIVYPADLLKELKSVLGDGRVGLLDPQNQLKPLLKSLEVDAEDLEDKELEEYEGKLIIAGPFASATQVPARFGERLRKLRERGVATVWIQPRQRGLPTTDPSYFIAEDAKQPAVIIAAAETIADIGNNPEAQIRLLKMVSLAINPKPFEVPRTKE